MGTIRGFKKRIGALNIKSAIPGIIESTAATIIELNQDQLYKASINSLGNNLHLYSSPIYALMKERMNPVPGFLHPDLYLTGAFFRGFVVDAGFTGVFTISSTDSKAEDLERKYGKEIFGLTKHNKTIYAKGIFWTALKTYIAEKTGITSLQ